MVRFVVVGHNNVLNQRKNSTPPLGTTTFL